MGPVETELRVLGPKLCAPAHTAEFQMAWAAVTDAALDACWEVAPTFGTSTLGDPLFPDILSEAIEMAEALGL